MPRPKAPKGPLMEPFRANLAAQAKFIRKTRGTRAAREILREEVTHLHEVNAALKRFAKKN